MNMSSITTGGLAYPKRGRGRAQSFRRRLAPRAQSYVTVLAPAVPGQPGFWRVEFPRSGVMPAPVTGINVYLMVRDGPSHHFRQMI